LLKRVIQVIQLDKPNVHGRFLCLSIFLVWPKVRPHFCQFVLVVRFARESDLSREGTSMARDKVHPNEAREHPDDHINGAWTRADLERMDAKFIDAVKRAQQQPPAQAAEKTK
jgi:hypothetical protein